MSETLSPGDKQVLKRLAPQLEELLQVDGEFTVNDLPGNANEEQYHYRLEELRRHRAVDKKGKTKVKYQNGTTQKTRIVQRWEWRDTAKQEIKRIKQEMSKLPCPENHRAHIYNDPEVPEGKLGCKHCAENGNHPEISKETVRELL